MAYNQEQKEDKGLGATPDAPRSLMVAIWLETVSMPVPPAADPSSLHAGSRAAKTFVEGGCRPHAALLREGLTDWIDEGNEAPPR